MEVLEPMDQQNYEPTEPIQPIEPDGIEYTQPTPSQSHGYKPPAAPPAPPPLAPTTPTIPPAASSFQPTQYAPPQQPQYPYPQQTVAAPSHPARPKRSRRRVRWTGRRGCACGPSCLIGCLGFVGVSVITFFISVWLLYSSYSNRLDGLLDQFDERLEAQDFGTTFIYDRQGRELYQVVGMGRRERIPLEQIPDVVKYATISVEDDTFYDNVGVDIPSIVRATRDYVRYRAVVSGASTITQQLVRDVLFDEDYRYERSVRRKADEALLAIVLTRRMSKDEILELYLNNIYYGNLAYGIEAASQTYFDKPAQQLQLHEAALLAGLPQRPAELNPLNPDPTIQQQVIERQHLILDLMVKEGYISRAEAETAKQQPLNFVSPEIPLDKAPHFVVYAQDELLGLFTRQYEQQGYLPEDAAKLAEDIVSRGGMRVYTTLDLDTQGIAEEAARRNIAALRDAHDLTNSSVVVLIPRTGEILAMVGSVNFDDPAIDGQVNVALAKRQPGSTMKPFTYSAAMEQGWVPSTVIWDTPISIGIPGQSPYEPHNYDRTFHGPVHIRDALANSYNIPAVQTLRKVGVPYLLDFMHRFGVNSLDRGAENYGLSLTLGGGDVTLLELTNAYAVFARGGTYVPTTGILCILNSKSEILYEYEGGCLEGTPRLDTRYATASGRVVLDPRIAYTISDILSDNQARTPAMGANSPLNTGNLLTSVKTGTTDDFRDNWTVGYTSDIAVGVWSGNSDNHPMRNVSGLQGAAPIWRETMIGIYTIIPLPTPQLTPPGGMYLERICNARALRDPAADCPGFRQEWFFEGTAFIPDGQGNLIPGPQTALQQQPPADFGPRLEEVQPGIIRTYARLLTPEQSAYLASINPGSHPQKYCLVPIEVVSSVPDTQLLLFAAAPPDPEDAKRAYAFALRADVNYAILPQFACTPETIAGGIPQVNAGSGDWEVNPTSSHPQRTAAIFCKADHSVEIYEIVNGAGIPAFSVSAAEIAAVGIPSSNTLVREGGTTGIRLYRLTSGELQLNARLGGDPNGYVVIWGGC